MSHTNQTQATMRETVNGWVRRDVTQGSCRLGLVSSRGAGNKGSDFKTIFQIILLPTHK